MSAVGLNFLELCSCSGSCCRALYSVPKHIFECIALRGVGLAVRALREQQLVLMSSVFFFTVALSSLIPFDFTEADESLDIVFLDARHDYEAGPMGPGPMGPEPLSR